jgi:hypothetical protein
MHVYGHGQSDRADFSVDLGHQCALERDFGKCIYPDSCHLRATHGMNKTKYVRYDKEGNEEYADGTVT